MRAVVVGIALAAAFWFAARLKKQHQQAGRLPAGVTPLPEFGGFSGAHYEVATQHLKAFAAEYHATFRHGGCTKAAVMGLHALRDAALKHMYELRMRLPNDLDAETALTQQIEHTDRLLREYIQEAQARCGEGASLLFPGPLDDAFYRKFYRAHNDAST